MKDLPVAASEEIGQGEGSPVDLPHDQPDACVEYERGWARVWKGEQRRVGPGRSAIIPVGRVYRTITPARRLSALTPVFGGGVTTSPVALTLSLLLFVSSSINHFLDCALRHNGDCVHFAS